MQNAPVQMSGWRAAWVLFTFWATVFVCGAVGAAEELDSDVSLVATVASVVSIAPLVLVHELGHAAAAVAVGYRVTGIHLTSLGDAITEIERPAGKDTRAREIAFVAAGPVVTLVALAALLVLPLEGFAAVWRAGVVTFGVLWTADILVPIDRPFGVERDGAVLARLWRERKGCEGVLTEAEMAMVKPLDELIIAGHIHQARLCISGLGGPVPEDHIAMSAAALCRAAILELLDKSCATGPGSLADRYSADAVRLCPRDPVCVEVRRRFEERNGGAGPATDVRPPTEHEQRLLAAWS